MESEPAVQTPTAPNNNNNSAPKPAPAKSSWSRPIQHIERKDLYTNFEARIRYLHSFLDFNSGACDGPLGRAVGNLTPRR